MIKLNTPYILSGGNDSVTFIEVSNGLYIGTYAKGSLTGVLKDGVLKATFNNTAVNVTGIMELTFHESGFEGRWKKGLEPGELKQKWNAILVESKEKKVPSEFIKTGFHVFTDEDGVRYEGEWNNDIFLRGKAESIDEDGEKIIEEGDFIDFMLSSGKVTYEDGSFEEGDFDEDGMLHEGKITWVDGSWASGVFDEELQLNGKGVYTWANGDFMDGVFAHGELLEGKAKITNEVGEVSEGMMKDGEWVVDMEAEEVESSENTAVCEDESPYEGERINGLRHGKGKVTLPGHCYEGDFSNDMMHGKGVYTWVSGISYSGDFVNHCFHGEGIKSFPNGDYYNGIWKVDEFISGIAKVTEDSGSHYEGEMLNGFREGKGRFTWPTGSYYEGDFVRGNFNGQGKLTGVDGTWKEGTWEEDNFISGNVKVIYDSGNSYEGAYLNGERNGWGVLTHSSGERIEGKWENGEIAFSTGDVVSLKSGDIKMTVENVFYKGINLVAECIFVYRGKRVTEEYDLILLKHLKN